MSTDMGTCINRKGRKVHAFNHMAVSIDELSWPLQVISRYFLYSLHLFSTPGPVHNVRWLHSFSMPQQVGIHLFCQFLLQRAYVTGYFWCSTAFSCHGVIGSDSLQLLLDQFFED